MNLPFKIDLSNKVAVVTGGGGILCSNFAKVIAECGAKVAILDLNGDAANKVADEINAAGGTAIGVSTNVLQKESLVEAKTVMVVGDQLLTDVWGANRMGMVPVLVKPVCDKEGKFVKFKRIIEKVVLKGFEGEKTN